MTGHRSPPDRTIDRLLDALSDERRRRALAVVADRTPPIGVRAIAGELAGSGDPAAAESAVETVAVELHHVHLPKLAEAGLLDYDAERRTAAADRDGGRVETALEFLGRISTDL